MADQTAFPRRMPQRYEFPKFDWRRVAKPTHLQLDHDFAARNNGVCSRLQSQHYLQLYDLMTSASMVYTTLCSTMASTQPLPATTPPYTTLSMPVYSLATRCKHTRSATMNLVTYASPVALEPRMYALGLYQGTQSRENMLGSGLGVLQILTEQHAPLFHLLGKTSGASVDKMALLRDQGQELKEWQGVPILADCGGAMELQVAMGPFEAGDHAVVLCHVTASLAAEEGVAAPLYTGYLRQLRLMP